MNKLISGVTHIVLRLLPHWLSRHQSLMLQLMPFLVPIIQLRRTQMHCQKHQQDFGKQVLMSMTMTISNTQVLSDAQYELAWTHQWRCSKQRPNRNVFQLMYNLCITSFWCDHSQDKKFIDRARIQYLSLHDVYYYKNHPLTSQCVSREVTRTNTGGVRLI